MSHIHISISNRISYQAFAFNLAPFCRLNGCQVGRFQIVSRVWLSCALDCALSGVFFCEKATEQEAEIPGRFVTSTHRGWLKFLSSSFNTLPASTLFFCCCCVRARRAEKWMKDVSQTEGPEMWQSVPVSTRVVLYTHENYNSGKKNTQSINKRVLKVASYLIGAFLISLFGCFSFLNIGPRRYKQNILMFAKNRSLLWDFALRWAPSSLNGHINGSSGSNGHLTANISKTRVSKPRQYPIWCARADLHRGSLCLSNNI